MRRWGRFSVYGSADFESYMSTLFDAIVERTEGILTPNLSHSLILLGGYGRGEGGVVQTDKGERPHNNLDFLLITSSISSKKQARLSAQIREALRPLEQSYGIEFDLASITESKLRRSPCLVIWYDMRFGHKTVIGDAGLVPSLSRFSVERIPAQDIRNLLVNRGTLIIINDRLVSTRELTSEERERVVKHTMKAIIGYGDALLFFLGLYDWSYVEKQKRMRACMDVPPGFQSLYEEAVEFRFRPNYAAYLDRDLVRWMDDLRGTLASIHLRCEGVRLHTEQITWESYAQTVFSRGLWDDFFSSRAWAKKVVNFVRTPTSAPDALSITARIGYKMLGLRGILPALFPAVVYSADNVQSRALVAQCLNAQSTELDELRRAYLFTWGSAVEPPFLQLAEKWNLSLGTDAST